MTLPHGEAARRPRASAVIVAAGSGVRFGSPDKVFTLLAGRPMVVWSIDAFERSGAVDEIIVVTSKDGVAVMERLRAEHEWPRVTRMVLGGARRHDSVQAGLAAVADQTEVVVIHDAARPCVEPESIARVTSAGAERGAAILAHPVASTLKRVSEDRIVATIPREGLWEAQTPQVFRLALLRAALDAVERSGVEFTDEAMVMEAAGQDVTVVPGPPSNLKVTVPQDLAIAEAILRHRRGPTEDSA